ncbi:MAG: hydrogenase maturation nickel metallochaperone HypA [Clostridia bacterium]|nr:hydrogenase maturation nickel metallochaperone HypA [Clostridia bacterium]MBR6479974.1 hydrogenase maturation nickel metallochaperone HypA [Clostridia bacterium]MBR6512097.1 hydrogenase maturation nickel metallochaperone HypA [Clostridia bacterium]
MHEIGTLYEIVKSVEKVAIDNHAQKVEFIELDLGELTGMLPIFFEKYYPIVIEERPLFKNSSLKINEIKGEGVCNNCGKHYNIRQYEGTCPKCSSRDKQILSGRELLIKQIGII